MSDPLTLIPSPAQIEQLSGAIDLSGCTVDHGSDSDAQQVADYLTAGLRALAGSNASGGSARVALHLTGDTERPEAYTLRIDGDEVTIQAATGVGLFYGAQTLLQLAQPSGGTAVPRVSIEDGPLLQYRSVHLDLRSNCLMPTFDYLLDTIRQLASVKINAVVLEWEDKFPYQRHPEIASPWALTRQQVDELLAEAARLHVQVIPLFQTLGHVEYILKHPEHAALREAAGDISQFCPSEPGSQALLRELIDELLEAHPAARYIHLGADETWLLGSCPRCAARAAENGLLSLYTEHLGALCEYVLERGRIPLLWGDIVLGRHIPSLQNEQWSEEDRRAIHRIPTDTRMLYWDYHGTEPEAFTRFEDYERLGYRVWVGPTTRSSDIVPEYGTHLPNISSLLQAGIDHGAEGAMITSWVWKNMPFEFTWHGLLTGAERAWAGGRTPQDELDERCTRLLYGADLAGVIQAMYLLSYNYWEASYKDERGASIRSSYLSLNPGHEYSIPHADEVRVSALRARTLFREAIPQATRRKAMLEDWEIGAWLVAHVAEKQELFAAYEHLLESPAEMLDPARIAELRAALEALARERDAVAAAWRDALLRTNTPESVQLDQTLRFAGERAFTTAALEQLGVFAVAEGRRLWR